MTLVLGTNSHLVNLQSKATQPVIWELLLNKINFFGTSTNLSTGNESQKWDSEPTISVSDDVSLDFKNTGYFCKTNSGAQGVYYVHGTHQIGSMADLQALCR